MAFLRDPWLPPLLPVTLPQCPLLVEAELEEKEEAGLVEQELEEVELAGEEEAGLVVLELEEEEEAEQRKERRLQG